MRSIRWAAVVALTLALTTPTQAAAVPGVLWEADPALGPAKVFDGLEQDPGSITVANDPQGKYGPSIKYETNDWSNGKERCESRGMRKNGSPYRLGTAQEGQTFYFGWRALWQVNPNAKHWIAVYQLHVSGVSGGQVNVGPFVLRTTGDGKLYFQHQSADGDWRHIWSAPFPVNEWNNWVIGFKLSRGGDGWVEFYRNGVPQKFSNGSTRYPGATLWGTHVNTKWGVYRSGANSGKATAYLNSAKLGTTYADVAL
jgi:hypothetical protein